MNKKLWFKRRRYGWGWTPVAWQGWVVITVYLIVVISAASMLEDAPTPTMGTETSVVTLIFILATAALLRISYIKGPKPKWRWGSSPDDNPEEDI